jgi:hypothetical protein
VRTHPLAPILWLALLAPSTSLADEAAPPEAPAAAPAPPTLKLEPPPDLDMLLLAPKGTEQADAAFEARVARRRTLLTAHQASGLATWALMGATVVVGQLNYHDLYGGGGYTQRYRRPHQALAITTTAAFAFTGLLAALAPVPYPKKLRLDTATIHKAAMGLTTLGLGAQIALGIATHRSPMNADQRRLAQVHQAVGYATFGAMTLGAVTLLF